MIDEDKALEIKRSVQDIKTWFTIAPITTEAKVTIFWNGQLFIFTPNELTIAKEDV